MADNNKKVSLFETLSSIDLSKYTEKRGDLSYLSWVNAIIELSRVLSEKSLDWDYEIKRFGVNNLPYVHDPNTGYMVSTSVTINGITREMWLPVMDGKNKTMLDHPYEYTTKNGKQKVEAATMFDINKTIMRCLTKNIAIFGLGIRLYQKEDLPALAYENALVEMEKAKTETELIGIWNSNSGFRCESEFSQAFAKKRKELAEYKEAVLTFVEDAKTDEEVVKLWDDNLDLHTDKDFIKIVGDRRTEFARNENEKKNNTKSK